MNHQPINRTIFKLTKSTPIWPVYKEYPEFEKELNECIETQTDLRFGQIVSNILAKAPEQQSRYVLSIFFGADNYDPFYEEPIKTLKHICNVTQTPLNSVIIPEEVAESKKPVVYKVMTQSIPLSEILTECIQGFVINGHCLKIKLKVDEFIVPPKPTAGSIIYIFTYNKETQTLISCITAHVNGDSWFTESDNILALSCKSIQENKFW